MAPNTSTKYDLEKFDGSNNFSLWRMKMRAVLIQQGLLKALKEKQGLPDTMSNDEKEDMLERAHSALLLDWFSIYRSFDGGKVLMKNDVACKVVGVSSIQIRMYDGIDSTVTGATTTASSSDIDSDTTKLRHMRLGHMSEKGMDMLSKQGYQLWCPDSESSWFLISKDVSFDESSMFSKKKELIDARKDQGIREKVELEVRAPDSLHIIPTDKEDGSHSTKENEEPLEQQNNIARNRPRREIRPPPKYGYADMVAYALCVEKSIELEQLDVKTTFLHGELIEQIFMRHPEGFVIQGKEDHVCLLRKSLYRLKQSPRQ
ncbi:hypothetical protein RJ639_009909 [Escallonia herrerae]|uniref:Retrovirus-related Pol polyprotein from transposon TNT 1-94 n=1 Tax=Escallonia herrerae TaxID=1293975 RepID=A0AA88VV37_9ASTE|nr:hypothetical protein RJ639_009909 [Escallonia herrerae]